MTPRSVPLLCWSCLAAALMACEHPKSSASVESATAAANVSPASSASRAAANGWIAPLGPVLLVEGQSPEEAMLIPANDDSASQTISEQQAIAIRSGAAVLLGHGDAMQVGILQAVRPRSGAECSPWPVWTVERGAAALAPWAVGFVTDKGNVVQPLPIDSATPAARGDSTHDAAEVTRLASTIGSAGASKFQGLPFSVSTMWRFQAAPHVEGIAATLVRQLNQEARPLEERTFLVAERDSTRRDAPYELAFQERTDGNEETIESAYVLAGVHLPGTGAPALVLMRDYGDGSAFALLERTGPARWRIRWTSRRAKC